MVYHARFNPKKVGVTPLMADKVDFRIRSITEIKKKKAFCNHKRVN